MAASCNQFLLPSFLAIEKQKNFISRRWGGICGFIYPCSQLNIRNLKQFLQLVFTAPLWAPLEAIYPLSLHKALETKVFQDSGRLFLATEGVSCTHGVSLDQASLLRASPPFGWDAGGMQGTPLRSHCHGHGGFSSGSGRMKAASWCAGFASPTKHDWDGMCHHSLPQGLESHQQMERKVPFFPFPQPE